MPDTEKPSEQRSGASGSTEKTSGDLHAPGVTGAVRGDRRPIKSRDTSWAAAVAAWFARQGVTPNQISIAGMAASIVAAVAIAFAGQESPGERVLLVTAAALMELRLLANLFDGMVAVEQGGSTAIGKLYNEVPDRISDGAVFFAAGFYQGASMELALGAVCVSIFVAYIRAADRAAGAPADFRGPMAKQHRVAVLIALCLFLAVTPSTWTIDWGPSGSWGLMAIALWIVIVGGLVTSLRRLITAGRFLKARD